MTPADAAGPAGRGSGGPGTAAANRTAAAAASGTRCRVPSSAQYPTLNTFADRSGAVPRTADRVVRPAFLTNGPPLAPLAVCDTPTKSGRARLSAMITWMPSLRRGKDSSPTLLGAGLLGKRRGARYPLLPSNAWTERGPGIPRGQRVPGRGYEDEVIVVIHKDCPLHKIVSRFLPRGPRPAPRRVPARPAPSAMPPATPAPGQVTMTCNPPRYLERTPGHCPIL